MVGGLAADRFVLCELFVLDCGNVATVGKGVTGKRGAATKRRNAPLYDTQNDGDDAVAKGKSEHYILYKQAKVDFTNNMIKTAKIVQNLKKAGLMG